MFYGFARAILLHMRSSLAAGVFPIRVNLWPQWISPLIRDIFVITTCIIVSIPFWCVGLLPDLPTRRDRAQTRGRKSVYGLFAPGLRGEARHWHRCGGAYLLQTPLSASIRHRPLAFFVVGVLFGMWLERFARKRREDP